MPPVAFFHKMACSFGRFRKYVYLCGIFIELPWNYYKISDTPTT